MSSPETIVPKGLIKGKNMKQIDVREGARRQHRAISLFTAIQCWLKQIDGVALQRHHLERLLGLERFKKTRIKWLQEDLKELFPYQEIRWTAGKTNHFSSLFISRLPLNPYLPKGRMSTKERIEGITKVGPKIEMFKMWKRPEPNKIQNLFEGSMPFFADYANYDERLLSSYLTLLAQGQISPANIPPLEKDIDED